MPSVYKRKNSSYWVIAYTDSRGRRVKKSSRCTDFDEAKKIAEEWGEAIRLVKKQRLVAQQHQTVIEEIYGDPKRLRVAPPAGQIVTDDAPKQRELASRLGICQATVSMALRGDRSISKEMRRKVQDLATELGYHSNPYVNALMSRVRSGNRLRENGIIAMLVDAPSQSDWYIIQSYSLFYDGVIRRSKELGFHVEPFFLQAPNMDAAKIERILRARGIQGVILAPPYRGNASLRLFWGAYAAVGVGSGWEKQELDRVAYDNFENFVIAFNSLRQLGYQRIGTILDDQLAAGRHRGLKWYTGHLECQDSLPRKQRIPVCRLPSLLGNNGNLDKEMFSPSFQACRKRAFQDWFERWHPDALLTIAGYEHEWLESMGIRCPEEIGLACLSHPVRPEFATINERGEEVGATALEWVASKIARNEYGVPKCPKLSIIEGVWVSGSTVRQQGSNLS